MTNSKKVNEQTELFDTAVPVWLKGWTKKKNVTCGLYAAIEKPKESASLRLAASGEYRVFVNGNFIWHGPVRCAEGFFRVDQIDLYEHCSKPVNHIAIEIHNSYINSFSNMKHFGFVQAEIIIDGHTEISTDEECGFNSYHLIHRVDRIQRYSYQRTFAESYSLTKESDLWRLGGEAKSRTCALERTDKVKLLNRELPDHQYTTVSPTQVMSRGTFRQDEKPAHIIKDRSLINISVLLQGYKEDELELHLSDEIQAFLYHPKEKDITRYDHMTNLGFGQYELISFPMMKTGFIEAELRCSEPSIIYLLWDEILIKEDIDPLRLQCVNAIRIELQPGEYSFQTFEPYGLKYLKWVCTKGNVSIVNACIREYRYPYPLKKEPVFKDNSIQKIWNAAVETFCQNSPDIFMDCPTRERAGWLCDSFFTSRAEYILTGHNRMERMFLENFLLPDQFPGLPEGMLPMCYPSDHPNGQFIPNWAMWFVLELGDYKRRNSDITLPLLAKQRVYDLIRYFKKFNNDDGMLENLESWIFVEWSKANDLVLDVNIPTNMLYSAMLREAGELYEDQELIEEAEKIKKYICTNCYDGSFFLDNAIRRNGKLEFTGEKTEVCQYYAFFLKIATPDIFPELWEVLVKEFGPHRDVNAVYPKVYSANAFIGNYLRLDCLVQYNCREQALKEMVGYFEEMAEVTGTLWEHMSPVASCNHGFASYAAYLLSEIFNS